MSLQKIAICITINYKTIIRCIRYKYIIIFKESNRSKNVNNRLNDLYYLQSQSNSFVSAIDKKNIIIKTKSMFVLSIK